VELRGVQLSENNIRAFLALVRAGLWETDVQLLPYGPIDFETIYCMAEEQSVVGLVTAGLEHVTDVRIPKEVALRFAGYSLRLEQQNIAMNSFISNLILRLRKEGIYALLVKGQGVAQCYERPLWRACGDVDLFLSEDNYIRAKEFLTPLATVVEIENLKTKHIGMTINQWMVELHGSLRSRSLRRMDGVIDDAQDDVFYGGNVRSWNNNTVQVFLPSFENDVIFIFTHILKHFFYGGIGLRQICDWCRLLWTAKGALDNNLLKKRLESAGILTEWKTFAAFVVDYLGMPIDAICFYSSASKWSRKANGVVRFIIKVGNLGHNRDLSYYTKRPYVIRKGISFCRRTNDFLHHFLIFPVDSIRVWCRVIIDGIPAALKKDAVINL